MSIRNIGILAHVDAGKTTISEHMLYLSGGIHSLGNVDKGTASTDWMEVEKARGISVRSAFTTFKYQDIDINLIDTPGHVDFAGEVERSLKVLDGAILVISAAEGIEAQTESLWQALTGLEIPVLIFLNKVDRKASRTEKVIEEIKRLLSKDIIPIQILQGEQTKNPEVYNILEDQTNENTSQPVNNNLLKKHRQQIYEFVAERNEEMLEKFVEEVKVSRKELSDKINFLIQQNRAYPLLYGSALNGVGIKSLMDAVIKYLPAPDINLKPPVSGVVFKIDHDQVMGQLTHIRLYNGVLENRDEVYNYTRDIKEKITQIKKGSVQKYKDIGILKSGDIGTLCGLKHARIGDILGSPADIPGDYHLANPVLKVQISPENNTDITKLISALNELEAEDPLLNVEWLKEKREIHLKIMGLIQLEILESILKDRFNIKVSFGQPSVIYKETPTTTGEGYVRYTMPKPCWAVLRFQIEPGERGSGVNYKSEVRPDQILPKYQKQVKKTIPDALEQGLYGWEVTDLYITLVDGEYHVEHTHPPDFAVATPMGIMDGLSSTGTTLLEPVLEFEITVPEDMGGKILGDLIQLRADYDSPVIKKHIFIVKGIIPVATSLDYAIKLSSTTGGRGILKTKFSGYKECPRELGATCPRRGVNPLDRSKYILSVRNAI